MVAAVLAALLLCAGGGAPSSATGRPAALFAAPLSFAVDSTVLLNEAARRDKEVSYKLRATLRVLPAWAAPDERLLRFELEAPQLLARGAHPNADYAPLRSVWDEHARSSFYAHWRRGLLQQLYLDPAELLDVQNFKRSLVSLFQLQLSEGERNETDVSGQCAAHYEALSDTTVRKVKRGCRAAGWQPGRGEGEAEEEEWQGEGEGDAEGEVQSRRLTRYSLNAARDALEEVYAEELHALGAAAAGAGLKARAWLRLTRAAPPAPLPALPAQHTLADALRTLPGALRPAPLAAAPPADLHATSAAAASGAELGAAAAAAGGTEPGAGGTLAAARAALALLRAAPRDLAALLHDAAPRDQLAGLCAALGLAGSEDAHRAAAAFLRLRHGDAPAPLAHVYFAALAQAPRAQPAVLDDALRLADELRDAALAESALLGAAAAAARAPPAAQRRARDALARGLARCADDACRRVRLAALANLRRADTAALLLQHAERAGGAAGAALDALDALLTARGALPPDAPPRLERVALGGSGAALDARAAALDLLLRASAAAPFALPRVLLRLRAAREHELLRLARQRLRALAPLHEPVRLLLRLLPPELRGWDAQALSGTSSLLVREAARGAGGGAGWRALLESRQVARGALLRRGRVRLLTLSPTNRTDDTITVELWTRGLDAFAGGAAGEPASEPEGEAEEAAGGLALSVGGARLRALTLFRGQAELLGHVWAGSGSEPTAVLRALRPAPPARVALPLLGGAALRYERRALLAAALDADAQVSLWARTARTRLALRAALAVRAEAAVRTAWGALEAAASAELEPRLRVDADLDFYDAVALCVRTHTDRLHHAHNVTLTSEMGAARRRVRRARSQHWPGAGRTLALGAPNDATCRAMGPARD